MIRLSMEAPISLLSELPYITDFDFVLTHLCEESETYLIHYQEMAKSGREVVLDNSVNELGEPVSIHQMNDVAKLLNPTYIIPPDHLNNLEATLGGIDDAVSLWGKEKVWPVIQGTSYEEVVECGRVLRSNWGFDTVCIPYDITLAHRSKLAEWQPDKATLEELSRTRLDAVRHLSAEGIIFKRYHLLGMNSLSEFPIYSSQSIWSGPKHWGGSKPSVSLDTGAPITNGLLLRKFEINSLVPKGIYFDYYEQVSLQEHDNWLWNVSILKGYLNERC